MYCTVVELRQALYPAGLDPEVPQDNTGTAADMSDEELTDVIVDSGTILDTYLSGRYVTPIPPSNGQPHPAAHFIALALAVYFATGRYRRGQDIGPEEPVTLAYQAAMNLLVAISQGKADLSGVDSGATGGGPGEAGAAINTYSGSLFTTASRDLWPTLGSPNWPGGRY